MYAHFKISFACRTLHILCSFHFWYINAESEKATHHTLNRTKFNHCAKGLQDLCAAFYGLNSDKDTDNEVWPERDKTVAYEFSKFSAKTNTCEDAAIGIIISHRFSLSQTTEHVQFFNVQCSVDCIFQTSHTYPKPLHET